MIITDQIVEKHGLSKEEFRNIKKLLKETKFIRTWSFFCNVERTLFI